MDTRLKPLFILATLPGAEAPLFHASIGPISTRAELRAQFRSKSQKPHPRKKRDRDVELYNSSQAACGLDHFGVGNKFITPMITNGKVFVGTTKGVGVFGLLM
jgi:hypothetical protein